MYSRLAKHFVFQHGETDCGPACLASIIHYHGGHKSLDEIRRLTGTTKTGTNLLGLYQGAKSLGFEVMGMEADDIKWLRKLDNPAILHVILENRWQHYVIFYGFDKGDLIIGDPGKGISLWEADQLEAVWQSGSFLMLKPSDTFVKCSKRSNGYKKIVEWIREDLNILISSLFLGILIALFSLATAIFSQKLIDVILPSKDISRLGIGLSLFGLVLFVKMGLGYIRSIFLITQSKEFNNRIISSFFFSLLSLPKLFFDSKKIGEMVARMNDTHRIQMVISNLFGNILIELLIILLSIAGIFIYSWQCGSIITVLVPFYIAILWKLNDPILIAQKNVMMQYALNEGNYMDVIGGITEIKRTGTLHFFHKVTTNIYRSFQKDVFQLGKIQVTFNLWTEFIGILMIISVSTVAAWLVLTDHLLLGAMMAILSLGGSITPSLSRVALFFIQLQEARVAFLRMDEFTGLEMEKNFGEPLSKIESITFQKVSFNFPGTLPLLKDINLVIEKGFICTLLGESGTGKSTLLQLIQRFYEPVSGRILINGNDMDLYELQSFRKHIGVVPQEVKIFNNYLLFNIALSDDQEELKKVVDWCQMFGFDQFFKNFPQGYMTLLGEEGANISGGQKQLVGLARALYRDPDVLLIDEGTAAMDSKTEQFILEHIQQIKEDIAVLMITHRKEVASISNRVCILEDGTIRMKQ